MEIYFENKVQKEVERIANIYPEDYREFFYNPDRDFTRDRILPLSKIVQIGVLKSGGTLNEELRFNLGLGHDSVSASAYIQQRAKLTPEFYRAFFDAQRFEITRASTLIKGRYTVMACDGSDINIFPNSADKDTLVKLSNNPHNKICNQIHLNALTTVPDGIFVDYEIQDHKNENESEALRIMLRRLIDRLDKGAIENIIITCDRGYEGYYLFMLLDSLGFKYCIRVKDINSNGISSRYAHLCDEDGNIDVYIIKKYTHFRGAFTYSDKYKDYVYIPVTVNNPFIPLSPNKIGQRDDLEITYYEFTFRLVRFKISEDTYEVVITNLTPEEFSAEDLKELYHLRWDIEGAFKQLKYYDFINFMNTKKKDVAIGTIVFAMIFHNICKSVMIAYAKMKTEREAEEDKRKYVYKVSYSDLSKSMRIFLAGRDPTATIDNLIRELERTVQPVRKNRSFDRFLITHSFFQFIYRAA